MKQKLKRIFAGLLLVIFLAGNMNSATMEVLAATISNMETEDAVIIKNEYVELSVNKKNAGYVIKTREGDILTKTDNNKPLNYRGGEGDTSFATLRINGKNYIYGNTKNGGRFLTRPYVDADKIISTWTQDNICVTQTLTVLTDSQEEKLGAVKITYTVWNTNDASMGEEGTVEVGARLVIDTQLGVQDYAVYEMAPTDVNGTYIQYTRETEFAQEDISAHFRSLDNNYQPRVVAYGYPDDSGIKPDKMVFGHWYAMAESLWDFEISQESFVDTDSAKYKTADSAVAMFWNESSLGADEKRTYSYYYGIQSNEDVGENDTVKLSVSMDKDYLVLNEEKTGYVDDEIHLQVMVSNTMPNSKTRAKMAVKLAIDTDYLTVLSAKDDTGQSVEVGKDVIFLTNLKVGQTRIINWTLKVKNPPQTIRYLKYILKAYTFTDVTEGEAGNTLLDSNVVDSVKRNILAPGISGEKPAVSILAGMPDELYYTGKRTFVVRGEGFEILASDKTEWQLKMTDLQTGKESFVDSTNIQFNADGTSMLVNFTEEMAEGEYQLTILPGTNLTDEQIGLPESITSDEMKFFMSSDEDLINPPVGGVGIRKDTSSGVEKYVIDVFETAAEAAAAKDYLLVLTGNLYQNAPEGSVGSKFIPIQGSGKESSIMINRIVSFSGSEMIIDYMYEDGEKVGVQVKMEGDAGVVGGSSKVWSEESQILLEDGKDYSLDPDEVESGFSEPIMMEMTGIAGIIQKIAGFIVDLQYGTFYDRDGYSTISFGGSLSVGFMSVDEYDGVDGVDLFSAEVQDVRYGEQAGKQTGFIGVKAETMVGVPRFIETLPVDLQGELKIDTIDHPYLVNVSGEGKFATFKAGFELEVIASKEHGIPVPNILSLTVGGVKPGAPIIIPVAPVVYLQGASGTVDGLYSLFYPSETGGWPDTNISLAGQLSIVDVFSGWVGISLGTSRASVYGDDMKILGMDFLESISGTFTWYPEVSFGMDAHIQIIKVIQGQVRCYLIMAGDNAPDLEMYGKVAIVLPSVFFGQDLTVAGVGLGGNKTKIYGSAIIMGTEMSYEYYWGDKSSDVNISLFRSRVGSGTNAGTIGLNNIYCVAKSTGELSQQASTYVMRTRAARVGSPTVSVNEQGGLVVSDMSAVDTMIRAYYDLQDAETLEQKDVTVTIGGDNYSLTGIEINDEGYAANMETANFAQGSNELGDYILITIPQEEMNGEIVISSDIATFSYGEAMVIAPVVSLDEISAEVESDSLVVSTTISNTENAEGTKEVYFSKTQEGDRAYPILTVDAEGNSYGLDADTSALDIPYYVPNGEYYVTTVIRGTQDGREFQSQLTTTEKVTVVNAFAPTEALEEVIVEASGDGNASITLQGYDASLMDGVYFSADRTNADGTVTEGYQAAFIENASIIDGQFEVALSPEETGNDYKFHVYPIKKISSEEEEKYAMGYETVSDMVNIPYPNPAKITVAYGMEYLEEEATLGSGEEAVTYTNKVFTTMPEDGIKLDVTTDKPVTGKILLDNQIISEIITPGTEFPSAYVKMEDGEHSIRIQTMTENGDTKITDESIKVDTTAPMLQLFTPETGSIVENNQIVLSGQVEAGAKLSVDINGQEVNLSDVDTLTGSFTTTINIPEKIRQYMIYELSLNAEDEYGRSCQSKATLLNPATTEISSVYLSFDGEKIESDTLSLKDVTSGKLTLKAMTASGEEIVIPEESVVFTVEEDEEVSGITVDARGNVVVTGESTLAVSAQYFVTEDFCYQADVRLDSYEEEMKTADAKEPEIVKNLTEQVICVSEGEEFTLSVEANSPEGGKISYAWYKKSADGECRPIGVDTKDLTVALQDKGTIHQYYVKITNTTRTTGINEAVVSSPIVTVYVKENVKEEDIKISGNHAENEGITWYQGDITIEPKEEGVELALVKSTEALDELEWQDVLVISGKETGLLSYPIVLRRNGQYITETYHVAVQKDNMAPEGNITLGTNIWKKFLTFITFGIFEDESQTLEIVAEDAHVGMPEDAIAYYKANYVMTEAALNALEEVSWTKGIRAVVEDGESNVIYARFTDTLGNVGYINSDGIVVGEAAPVITIEADTSTLLEEDSHRYIEKANLNIVVKDDANSNGIVELSYRMNNEAEVPVEIEADQTEIRVPLLVDAVGINTISITAKDKAGKETTVSDTVEIYQKPDFTVEVAEEIIYDEKELEIGSDLRVSAGDSKGEISYSYLVDGEYQSGLPTDAGVYEVKVSLARDAKNYFTEMEKIVEVTILKAIQKLEFSSECYKPVVGESFKIIVGGIKTTGNIEFTTENDNILRILENQQNYDVEMKVASILAEVLAIGNTTITVTVEGDKNYLEAQETVNVQVTEEVSQERPYIIVGTVGNNGWYTSDVTIQAADGFMLATEADGNYQNCYSVVGEGKNLVQESLYFKNQSGEVREIVIDEINIDMTAPTGTITANASTWRTFLNTITFGVFFKDTVVVKVDASDAVSGMDNIGYYRSSSKMSMEQIKELNASDWKNVAITLKPDEKAVVYTKLTDKAGNVTYLSTDGIIVDKTPAIINVVPSYDTTKWITTAGASVQVTVADTTAGITKNGVTYQIDGGTVMAGTEKFEIKGLADGIHNILITAVDNAGNKVTQTVSWKQDTKAPVVSLSQTTADSINITASTGVSGIASVQISFNGGTWEDITQTYKNGYAVTEYGTYEVRMTTNAGITVSDTSKVADSREEQKITVKKAKYELIYGQKAFKLNAKSDKQAKLTYKSSDTKVVKVNSKGKVTIKGCGKAEIIIRGNETAEYKSAEKKITITVLPKQTKLQSVSSKKAKTMIVKWKRDKQASGYQITFAANKKFKKAQSLTVSKNKTTQLTIKKLSAKKTYYVKVRAFKKSGNKKIYGKYSTVKKVKVK